MLKQKTRKIVYPKPQHKQQEDAPAELLKAGSRRAIPRAFALQATFYELHLVVGSSAFGPLSHTTFKFRCCESGSDLEIAQRWFDELVLKVDDLDCNQLAEVKCDDVMARYDEVPCDEVAVVAVE